MEFTGINTSVYLYIDTKLLFLNGVKYEILPRGILNTGMGRFSFGNYQAKLFDNKLTLVDKDNKTTTLIKKVAEVENNTNTNTSRWEKYVIYADNYISISNDLKSVRLNGEIFPVLETQESGPGHLYVTSKGNLEIFPLTSNRRCTWNNIPVMLSI
jgi:hypothetical protein